MFESFASFITNPIISGIIGGLTMVLLAYFDAKYRDIERERQTYLQLFFLSMIIVSSITYFALYFSDTSDEFLDQKYDTVTPSSIKIKKRKGGFVPKKISGSNQQTMKVPKMSVMDMFNKLPEPGTVSSGENLGESLNKGLSNVEIDITPKK